jgi:hypothetical protein
MQMFDVLTKLAALDSANPTIANPLAAGQKQVMEADQVAQLPALEDMSTLRALSGLKPVAECGMMGMPPSTPASMSINATAATGDEVTNMLSQIMNLAGVHKVGQEHMPAVDGKLAAITAEPAIHGSPADAMNPPEDEDTIGITDPSGDEVAGMGPAHIDDEGAIGGALGAAGGALLGGPLGAMAGGAMGGSMEDESAMSGGQAEPGTAEPMQRAADEIRGMADKLKDIEDKDELNLETYDNSPADPTNVPPYDANKMALNTNAGGVNKGITNAPSAMAEDLESKLFAEYQQFVSEGKKDKKADKDYDGDGEVESNKDEVWGSRAKAAAKAGKPFGKK